MNLLTVANISKRFGDTTVLDDLSLQLASGDAVGLVGPNGVGKTTLLEIMTGRLAADAGTVTLGTACTVGYLAQRLVFDDTQTVSEYIDAARGGLAEIAREMRDLEMQMAQATARQITRLYAKYDALADEFEMRGGYATHEIDEVMAGLGLAALEQGRQLASLSGGEQARLGLAALLLGQPDLLLLDEPTNHLDFAALEWLEEFLSRWRGGLLIVSHDRRFLDKTVRSIVQLDGATHRASLFTGNYSAYAQEKAQQQLRMAEAWAAQQEEIRELRRMIGSKGRQVAHNRPPTDSDGFTYAFKGGRVDATVARNVHAAEEKLARIQADPLPRPPRNLAINTEFDPATFGIKLPLTASGLAMSFGDRVILQDVECTVGPRTRAVIVGPNGAGKSTLLKILAGVLQPDAGRVTRAPGVVLGYLEQEQALLEPGMTVYEHYANGLVGDWETLKTGLLTTNLFTWPELTRPLEVLSVGQMRKVQIARLLALRANVLLLDEPTNHISLDVLEQFEHALMAFRGPIVAASHDRRFIERFGAEIWEIGGVQLHHYPGWEAYRLAHATP